jgi:nitrous oxidase accessory protein
MSRASRLLTVVAVLLLGALYVTPLWRIRLVAPQYPEGLGMLIRLDTIAGMKENDLHSINALNHYIGMRPIEASAIPELRYMPVIVAGLMITGALVALACRRRLLAAWVTGFAALGVAGLYDFWRWGYVYGHNLDAENAIIAVPGMSYQPPLIGTKQLLNFTASSWPHVGGVLAGVAFLIALTALVISYRRRVNATPVATSLLAATMACAARPQHTIILAPTRPPTIAEAVHRASAGDSIVLTRGVYREPTIIIDRPLTITGEPGAIIDGARATHILRIEADDVTVRGLTFRNVTPSHAEDRAAIRAGEVHRCRIEDNHIDNAFFGIYLAGTTGCRVARNRLRGVGRTEDGSGNGIHLWTARDVDVADNEITNHRDGIYLEFAHQTRVTGNVSQRNLRYGMHFKYADDCRYERNVFRGNSAGVAVMYTRRVEMIDNRFESNWGSAAYGLLLKEIYDAHLTGNRFVHNTTALLADGATRLTAAHNLFADNGWAVKLMASTQDATFAGNEFLRNTFDVSTNSRQTTNRFRGNYWDEYRGYDLNRDGVGDIGYRPVRLFSLLVERNEPTLVLLRSPIVKVLDVAERMLPSLTPELLVDSTPRLRRAR